MTLPLPTLTTLTTLNNQNILTMGRSAVIRPALTGRLTTSSRIRARQEVKASREFLLRRFFYIQFSK